MSSSEDSLDRIMEVRIKDRVRFIPIKESKQIISLRVLPKAVQVLDRFAALNGEISRTRLIERLVEALALTILSARYRAKSIIVVAVDEDDQPHFGAVVFSPDKSSADSIIKRIYGALKG